MSELWSAAQLAVFARVIELNGFSAAARAYGVPKVAISRAIADLEKSIGIPLMKRTTRRIFLTAAGEAVLPHARAIGVEVEKVRQLTQTFSLSREGPLRVVADPTYGRVLLAPLVPRFLDSFPDIALDVVLDADQSTDWDVAIRAGENADPTLGSRLLGAPPAVLCATPAYLQKHPAPERPEGLREHALLTPAVQLVEDADAPVALRRALQDAVARSGETYRALNAAYADYLVAREAFTGAEREQRLAVVGASLEGWVNQLEAHIDTLATALKSRPQ